MAGVNGFKFKLVIQATIRCSTDSQIHKSILPLLIQSNWASEKRYLKIVVLLVPCLIDVHLVWMACPMLSGFQKWYKTWKRKAALNFEVRGIVAGLFPLEERIRRAINNFSSTKHIFSFCSCFSNQKVWNTPIQAHKILLTWWVKSNVG